VKSSYTQIIEIEIRNQFGNKLHKVYDKTNAVEEKFENVQFDSQDFGSMPPMTTNKVVLNEPDGKLENGIIFDLVGLQNYTKKFLFIWTPQQIDHWKQFQLPITLGGLMANHTVGLRTSNIQYSGLMKLYVHGHELSGNQTRVVNISGLSFPPHPINVNF